MNTIPETEQVTKSELDEFQELMEEIKKGRLVINNELSRPVDPTYLGEVADFISQRIPHIPVAYIGSSTYARATTLESLLS